MKGKHAVSFRKLLSHAAAVRTYIILLIAIFALSGSLYSQDAAKGKAAATPCVKGNCVNGNGEMNFASGDAYKGGFRKGTMHGQGEMTWKSGDRYKGMWKDGKMDGRGEMKWAIGDRYSGMWKGSQMDGIGEMTWKNGMKYTGQWKSGKQHGNGVLVSTDRKATRGKWDNGTMVVEPPKGGAVPDLAGNWGRFGLLNPDDAQFTENPYMEYTFAKGGTGTWKRLNSESEANGKTSWKFEKNVLTIQHLEWEGGPAKFNYDGGKKYFTEEPRPYGPFEKVQVVSIIKKR